MLPSVGSRVTGSCATAQATAGVSAAAARRRPRLHAACGTCGTSEASCTNATTLQQLAADPSPKLQPWQQRWRRRVRCHAGDGPKPSSGGSGSGGKPPGGKPGGGQDALENIELLVGDCLCLLCFALYKQITAIIFLPNFPGWLAPLHFNPTRLLEFVSFATTLVGTWVAAGMLTGGFRFAATADVPTALSRTCRMWLISMPVAAAQLVLLTAAEDAALVGDEGWASRLPLAATGPGEPFVTAAGVLGLMAVWRAFYASYLDAASFRALAAARRDRSAEMAHFADSLRSAMLLSLACCAVLQCLGQLVGEEELELLVSALAAGQALGGGGLP